MNDFRTQFEFLGNLHRFIIIVCVTCFKLSFTSPNIRTIIITWLEKVDAPVDISRDRIEEIADLCIDEAYSDNRESTFVKPIDKIVSEIVKEHLNKEAKK